MKKILILMSAIPIMLFSTPFIQMKSNDSVQGHVDQKEKKYYHILLSNKAHTATVKLTNLDADVDMYIGINTPPRIRANDCYSANSKTKDEKCTLSIPASEMKSTSLIVMINGFKESSYTLEVSTKDGVEEIQELTKRPLFATGNLEKNEDKNYKFSGKKGERYIITLDYVSGDPDLRVKIGKKATKNTFDCKSLNSARKSEECSITLKQDNMVYINVNGYTKSHYVLKGVGVQNGDKRIKEAKKLCTNKSNIVKESYICSIEKDIVYIMDTKNADGFFHYDVYRVNINPKIESVRKVLSEEIGSSPSHANFISLKDTKLIGIKVDKNSADTIIYHDFYDMSVDKLTLELRFLYQGASEPYSNSKGTAETIENGTILRTTYIHKNDGFLFEDLYDIKNLSDIQLISRKRIK